MADQKCIEACEGAYNNGVTRCNQVLMDCLATAKTEEEIKECKERFKKCMALCKQVKGICLESCNS